tara:strand:- start:4779 stop:5738 length:960 start_codon:yes stop_codon:yes gene_type:complete
MNLAIDGNYILNRNLFPLVKDNLLYGYLADSLENSVNQYAKWYPFKNIYFISDSRTNWRKNVYPDYKGNRVKSDDIDWEFIFTTYTEFKENLPKRFKVLETDLVEGDDWFYYLCNHHNEMDESVLMVSNDGDLKQLIRTEKECVNLMVNENHRHNNIFLPIEYKTWATNRYDSLPLPGLFDDLSEEFEMLKFITKLQDTRDTKFVNPDAVIFEKLVAGDAGDNIKTVWGKPDKNGNIRGLGVKSAEKLFQTYLEYFGEPKFDEECFDRITDIIIEFKKLDSSEFDKINENIIFNNNLVNFDKIPESIINRIKNTHENIR